MVHVRCVTVAAALAATLACHDPLVQINCTDELRAGIVVTVRDSATSAPVFGARVVARNATLADTSRAQPDGVYPLVHEKAGAYTVTVEQAGYRPWTRTNVRVTSDACHVKTVSLTALLQPQS
jgi:hypothetical protein